MCYCVGEIKFRRFGIQPENISSAHPKYQNHIVNSNNILVSFLSSWFLWYVRASFASVRVSCLPKSPSGTEVLLYFLAPESCFKNIKYHLGRGSTSPEKYQMASEYEYVFLWFSPTFKNLDGREKKYQSGIPHFNKRGTIGEHSTPCTIMGPRPWKTQNM